VVRNWFLYSNYRGNWVADRWVPARCSAAGDGGDLVVRPGTVQSVISIGNSDSEILVVEIGAKQNYLLCLSVTEGMGC
jgi:hypothetical protein